MLVTDKFVLIHVPKTGGTFLSGLVREHCEVVYEQLHAPWPELPREFRSLAGLAFVRNPWDWYVSYYQHLQHDAGEWETKQFDLTSFDAFLATALDEMPFDYYSRIVWDFTPKCRIAKTENLRSDFAEFLNSVGINGALLEAVQTAPAANVGDRGPYRDYYSSDTAKRVGQSLVARAYGYEF